MRYQDGCIGTPVPRSTLHVKDFLPKGLTLGKEYALRRPKIDGLLPDLVVVEDDNGIERLYGAGWFRPVNSNEPYS